MAADSLLCIILLESTSLSRLRYNKGQVRTDKFTYAGAVTGGLIGLAAMPEARALGGLHGACVGVGLAVFAHVLTKPLTKGKET